LMPSSSSGARYHKVTTTGVYGFNGEPYSRARPKSPIYDRQEMPSNMNEQSTSNCLEDAFVTEQKVGRLQVAMNDPIVVKVIDAA
jgi:hypothetical protein